MSTLREIVETLYRLPLRDALCLLHATFERLRRRRLATPDDYTNIVKLLNQIAHDDQAA